MNRFSKTRIFLLLTACFLTPCGYAQQSNNTEIGSSADQRSDQGQQDTGLANNSAARASGYEPLLSGAGEYNISTSGDQPSSLTPSFRFGQSIDTNVPEAFGKSHINSVSTLTGTLALQRFWKRSDFKMEYDGGTGYFGGSKSNGFGKRWDQFHAINLNETFIFPKYSIFVGDEASYLPESAFGFGGFSPSNALGLGSGIGQGLTSLGSQFSPSQTIANGRGPRVSNTTLAELEYRRSPVSSFTLEGSYGLLRFLNSGFVNSNQATLQAGYDRSLTARDSAALIYGFSAFRLGSGTHANSHFLNVAYGHRVNGRLALKVAAGPQVTFVRSPASFQPVDFFGFTLLLPVPASSRRIVSWNVQSSFQYQFLSNSTVNVGYARGTTGGSGVLSGAMTDTARVFVDSSISPRWSTSVGLSYARNNSLQHQTQQRAINSGSLDLETRRSLSPSQSIFMRYNLLRQNSGQSFCIAGDCNSNLWRNVISIGIEWNLRPIRIQ